MSPAPQAASGGGRQRARHRAPTLRGGRHRAPDAPSLADKALRTGGVTAALVGGGLGLTALPASAATANDFYRLRMCESGNNYATNTGNNFYGAYQFDAQTWHGLGYPGLPSEASPATQDEAAYRLYNSRGWSPWPACSAKLGLSGNGPAPSATAPTPPPAPSARAVPAPTPPATRAPTAVPTAASAVAARPPVPRPRPLRIPTGPAPFGGTVLSTGLSSQVRTDTLRWQARMRQSRFMLTLDGKFGPQSAGVAALYSYLSGVRDGQLGVVGPRVWGATVNQPRGL